MKLPAPRLLPITITTMSLLLVVKCGVMLHAVLTDGTPITTTMVASANAADADQDRAKAAARPQAGSPPLAPPPHATPADRAVGGAQAGGAAPKAGASAEAAKGSARAVASAPTPSAPEAPPVSDSEKALLQELRQRRKDLEQRETAITTRESVLAASEQQLSSRVSELQSLQKRLEALDAARKQKEEAGWDGLVKLYEAMKPKDAATIFNELSMPVLLQVLNRMKDTKAAAVMAAMSPEKARDVTSELAQLRTGRDPTLGTADAALPPLPPSTAQKPASLGG